MFRFRLFVAGDNSRSQGAIDQARALCSHLPDGRWDLEIVDVLESADLAEEQGILATPTLVCLAPYSRFRIVGSYRASDILLRVFPTSTSKIM